MKNKIIESLFEDYYIYAPIIYKLIKNGKLDYYIKKLENENYYATFNNEKMEYYKHFIMMIDNFIDYLMYSLNLNHVQLLNVLDSIFDKLENSIFLTKSNLKENYKINKRTIEYKKIILAKFRNNLKFVITRVNYNIDLNDDRVLFNFLIDCCNVRKNHQYILFDDFNEYLDNPKKTEFYLLMWKLVFEKLDEN
ncbi:MAG: hypothetical protein E7166_00945 [Firmicutes bacterium]|nr:hypothetical protein [Bacillota bacterium]